METGNKRTTATAGTAVLAALVVIFDYTLKFSNLKIPFPWFPVLKFDLTGIPIALSLLLYGLRAVAATSAAALLGILARSGNLLSASMKALAELSTVLGMAPFFRGNNSLRRTVGVVSGLAVRAIVMSAANLIVLPTFYPKWYDLNVALLVLPLISLFNIVQGGVSIFPAYFIYKALLKVIPSLKTRIASI